MSVYDRLYSARIAPCTANAGEAIRNGIDVIDQGRRWTESIREGALIKPTHKTIPVLLSHDESRAVGKIHQLISHNGWWIADFTLDHSQTMSCVALDLLRVGAPVSVGYRSLRHDPSLAKVGVMQHTVALLQELSILRHGDRPAYPGAEVTYIYQLKPIARTSPKRTAAAATTSEPAGEVFYGGPLIRRNVGQVLGVR